MKSEGEAGQSEDAGVDGLAILAMAASTGLYAFFMLCKHLPYLSAVAPFLNDPYDAVGSFTFQIAIGVAALGLIRSRLMKRHGRHGRRRFVLRGHLVVAICIGVTVITDAVALARAGLHATSPPERVIEAAMAALTCAALAMGIGVFAARRRISAITPPGDDEANELDALFGHGAAARWSPGLHPMRFALVFSTVLGLGVATAELLGDGPAPTPAQTVLVFAVFTIIEGAVTFAGTLVIGRWLGILGPLRNRRAQRSAT